MQVFAVVDERWKRVILKGPGRCISNTRKAETVEKSSAVTDPAPADASAAATAEGTTAKPAVTPEQNKSAE